MYRLAWTNLRTGKVVVGPMRYSSRTIAGQIAAAMNLQWPEFAHWAEPAEAQHSGAPLPCWPEFVSPARQSFSDPPGF